MDCMKEWDGAFSDSTKKAQWLTELGMKMVNAAPPERAELMSNFVQELLQSGVIAFHETGWVMCAEVYANAMAINELTKFSTTLQKKV